MKYLSFDIEATGLEEHDLIIEFAMVPFCSETMQIENSLSEHFFVECPPFSELRPKLNQWVIDNNETLIDKANTEGISIAAMKNKLTAYFEREDVKKYFEINDYSKDKIVLFGKSMNAIDLPFLNRDLGYNFMRKYFQHRVLDLSGIAYAMIDLKKIPKECESGSKLMSYLDMGEVCHTALEDAVNTAKMYIKLLKKFS